MDDSPYRTPANTIDGADISDGPDISGDVRGMQIITASLMMGVMAFMGVALVMNEGELRSEPDLVSWVGIGFATIAFVAHVVVPTMMRREQIAQLDPQEVRNADSDTKYRLLIPIYRSTHIIACALLEGAAFFNLIAYQTEAFMGALGVAMFLALSIGARFPTEPRIRSWIRHITEEMQWR